MKEAKLLGKLLPTDPNILPISEANKETKTPPYGGILHLVAVSGSMHMPVLFFLVRGIA